MVLGQGKGKTQFGKLEQRGVAELNIGGGVFALNYKL